MRDVLDHPDKPWDWCGLSCNPSITMQDVLEYPDKLWDWNFLSRKNKHHDAGCLGVPRQAMELAQSEL
jgi:hypothetical protein